MKSLSRSLFGSSFSANEDLHNVADIKTDRLNVIECWLSQYCIHWISFAVVHEQVSDVFIEWHFLQILSWSYELIVKSACNNSSIANRSAVFLEVDFKALNMRLFHRKNYFNNPIIGCMLCRLQFVRAFESRSIGAARYTVFCRKFFNNLTIAKRL